MMVNRELLDLKVKEVNLTYSALAYLVGCDRTTFYKIKVGKTNPSYHVMNSIIYTLNLSHADIFEIFFSKRATMPVQIIEKPRTDVNSSCSVVETGLLS